MKIGNSTEQPRIGRPVGEVDRARPAASVSGPAAAVTDTVALSATSQQLAAGGASGASGAFDAQKVAAVRAAIASGTFKVDAQRVAERLIGNTADLLGVRPSR